MEGSQIQRTAKDSQLLTDEQQIAVERREGDLLVSAGAGSGKTTVMVERFVRSVVEDGVPVNSVLAITFTENAAAELKQRVRQQFLDSGYPQHADAVQEAAISTVHGFGSRLLQTHSLQRSLPQNFQVLDQQRAELMLNAAFSRAVDRLAQADSNDGFAKLLVSYGLEQLRSSVVTVVTELRSAGQVVPELPDAVVREDLSLLAKSFQSIAKELTAELSSYLEQSKKPVKSVLTALDMLSCVVEVPETLDSDTLTEEVLKSLTSLELRGGTTKALNSELCIKYRELWSRFTQCCVDTLALRDLPLLKDLVSTTAKNYRTSKRREESVDFLDLELETLELLRQNRGLQISYKERFKRVMVDEFQDTSPLQVKLIELLTNESFFMVGDEQQSIYGFRGADVAVFQAQRRQLLGRGLVLPLTKNFRSSPQILDVVNSTFQRVFSDTEIQFQKLEAGGKQRDSDRSAAVEVVLVDKQLEQAESGDLGRESGSDLAKQAEAEAVARRIRDLVDEGRYSPGDFAVLLRAMSNAEIFKRALTDLSIPTYTVGSRGFWDSPEVKVAMNLLAVVVTPFDDFKLLALLKSFAGLSGAELASVSLYLQSGRGSVWEAVRSISLMEDLDTLSRSLSEESVKQVQELYLAITDLRSRLGCVPASQLLYQLMKGSHLQLEKEANLCKLLDLADEFERRGGGDLSELVDYFQSLKATASAAKEEQAQLQEAGEGAVKLMTIHQAKGLEFPVVCVADLGSAPRINSLPDLAVRGDQFGLRLRRSGVGSFEAFKYADLKESLLRRSSDEERRLFYVALTRAQEKLLLSSVIDSKALNDRGVFGRGAAPVNWLLDSLWPEMGEAVKSSLDSGTGGCLKGPDDVEIKVVTEGSQEHQSDSQLEVLAEFRLPEMMQPQVVVESPVAAVSYSSLHSYQECPYRFYVESVLNVNEVSDLDLKQRGFQVSDGQRVVGGVALGRVVHELLELVDYRSPKLPNDEQISSKLSQHSTDSGDEAVASVKSMLSNFLSSALLKSLESAVTISREASFSYSLAESDQRVTGAVDLIAEFEDRTVVIDYKTDALHDRTAESVIESEYSLQRSIYALAALKAGSKKVDLYYVFLAGEGCEVLSSYDKLDASALESTISEVIKPLEERKWPVSEKPSKWLCNGCSARGNLCSWPLEETLK